MADDAHLLVQDLHGEVRHALTGNPVSLGSDPGCTIQLVGPGIDAHHALLQREGEHHVLFDLSHGRTTVNGTGAGSCLLENGDQIRIGSLLLVYLHAAAVGRPNAPQATFVTNPGTPTGTSARATERALQRTTTQAASVVLHALLLIVLLDVRRDTEDATPTALQLTNELAPPGSATEMPDAPAPAIRQPAPLAAEPSLSELAAAHPPRDAASPVTVHDSRSGLGTHPDALSELATSGRAPSPRQSEPATIGLGAGLLDDGDGTTGANGSARAGAEVALTAGGSTFRERVYALQGSGLDVAVVIDSTSSMQSVLDAARTTVGRIVATLSTLIPNFRLAVVTYRDTKDEYVTRHSGFSSSPWNAVHFMEGLKPEGGGDTPESVLEALQVALQRLEWSPKARRVVLLVGDAPGHEADRVALKNLVRTASERTTIHCVVTPTGGIGSLRGANPATVEMFGEIATIGRGSSTLLGNAESLIGILFASTFGTDQKDAALRALTALEGSLAVRSARKAIQRGDPLALLASLTKDPPPAHALRILLEAPDAKLLPVFLRVVEDPRSPEAAKAACIVLIGRVLRASGVREATLNLALSMEPRAGPARLARSVRELKTQLRRDLPGQVLDLPGLQGG